MKTLQGKTMRYAINEHGQVVSVYNRLTCHEYVYEPAEIWKIIYSEGTERVEIPIWAQGQAFTRTDEENGFTLTYDSLQGDGRRVNFLLRLRFTMTDEGLTVVAEAENHDDQAKLIELQLTPAAGMRSLSGTPENDYIAWPSDLGKKVKNPAYNDLSTYAGFRKYERHDQFHTDMDALYGRCSMQWYDWYNEGEGLYCASEDAEHQALCLHIERDVKLNLLKMGFIRYPMLEKGECWTGAPLVFKPHLGDWHAGAKMYRAWMDKEGGFIAPDRPKWCQDFKGWLRVIMKQHHCEINWDYSQIPALYDELEENGFDTLFLLGWEKGGFARMWPDYIVDDRMGGEEKLREGIEYVHKKGGRVLMFLSYSLIDYRSDFYLKEGGAEATMKSIWGLDIPFAETYCGEGTYRKIGNPPMPMYRACPGSELWQKKMIWAARQCMELGADGVLYDLGGLEPFFCYARNHTHKKPSQANESKARLFAELRRVVRSYGEDKVILMEHNVDIYGMSMDVAQGHATHPERRFMDPSSYKNPDAWKQDSTLREMYRYTFPELVMTNRECGEDENHYRAYAGYSFLLGLRFDMTIWRCCGSLKDIPNYAAYLKQLNAVSTEYAEFVHEGRFVDTDGFTASNPCVLVKGWRNAKNELGFTLWNYTDQAQTTRITSDDGQTIEVTVAPETATAARL